MSNIEKYKRSISAVILVLLLLPLYSCANRDGIIEPSVSPAQSETSTVPRDSSSSEPRQPTDNNGFSPENEISGELTVTFDFIKQSGSASNQFAVWVEDANGNYINTLYATKFTAKGGYKNRPDSIPLWVEKSGITSMPDYYIDAVSGATPSTGNQSYTWNLKDINGDPIAPGDYIVLVEGTLRWKNRVIYSGVIKIDSESATIQTDAEYIYEASDKQPALTGDSKENEMVGMVSVRFIP